MFVQHLSQIVIFQMNNIPKFKQPRTEGSFLIKVGLGQLMGLGVWKLGRSDISQEKH